MSTKAAAPATTTKAPVPESVQKKVALKKDRATRRAQVASMLVKKNAKRRQTYFKRAEKYVAEYRKAARQEVAAKRAAKAAGNFYIPAQPKLAVVIRIRGILGVPPKPKKVLQLLRLRQINNAVFLRINKATTNMLRLCEPYVAWGYPTLKTIKQLVYKRGYFKINGARVPLESNLQIEKKLGKHGFFFNDTATTEIYTVGQRFSHVNKFLWPFKLNNPSGGFRNKGIHYIEGGDAGNREDLINNLLKRMI
eukprot:TRINITY_DN644_c0_g1_i1.p1 TRINITY_DN644_c0_g1~~TRINITY_DN644_c0_g1_i1.p1  ORF type:complete len:251 (-),score=66.44 TRINITY_DN644_c0_g1_i1:62-814(-)